jgi:hypothetical protein
VFAAVHNIQKEAPKKGEKKVAVAKSAKKVVVF